MILHPLGGGGGIGIYRIQLTNPVKDLSDLTAKFSIMSADGKIAEPVHIRLTMPAPKYNRSNNIERRQGTLVTIVRVAIGTHRAIPNSVFDKTLEEHGEIIKPTELQKLRGTSVLNGNRYCVIDSTNKGTIPDSLSVIDPTTKETVQFHLRYKGQSWFCRRCDECHVGPCKALQAFYEAKDRRAKETINIKIASDSTLRCAEQVGLRTDIMCMPGGGMGQIANAIKDDPDIKDRKEIIVLAGTNDVRNQAYQDLHSFAYVVDTSIQKVKEAVPEDSKLTFLRLASNPNDDTTDPDRRFKETYLGQVLEKAQDDNTTVITIFTDFIDMDGTDHPTREGTASILQTLEEYHPGLILDDNFLTTDRLYLGVQPLFQYGCTTCHEAGLLHGRLCVLGTMSREINKTRCLRQTEIH